MRYRALAADYDGTLASEGTVLPETLAALQSLGRSGIKLVLVTGRHLDDLLAAFPQVEVFDRVVAENGALLYRPREREELVLGLPPPEQFLQLLQDDGIPFSPGKVIVASHRPYEDDISRIADKLGLELRVILNKGAVMLLPPGIDKGSGLIAALRELELRAAETVGVGDAENDLDFLEICGYRAAVANGLPMVKEKAEMVTEGGEGAGVSEVIQRLWQR